MKSYHSFRRAMAVAMLAAFIASAVAGATNLPLPPRAETESITARDLKKHLSFLASDELGGRYTISPANRIAARYLASQLEAYGYRGGARDGSFFQKVPLSFRTTDMEASRAILTVGNEKTEFKHGDGFASFTGADMTVAGELVYVGYGISSPANQYDDYAGLDVKGKIVVIAQGFPEALKGVKLTQNEQGGEAALAHGATSVIEIPPAQFLLQWNQIQAYFSRGGQISLPAPAVASVKGLPAVLAGPDFIQAIAKAIGKASTDLLATGKPLQPVAIPATVDIRVKVEIKPAPQAQNVVGILDGTDPKLKNEYVVISAHYDHLETNAKGEVYNGADDDGSGTVSVLEIAQAFALGAHPKRSVLIIFHTGEELGLLGSLYNTDYEPVVPLDKLVTDLNIDMVGRSRPEGDTDPRDRELSDKDTIYVIGADKLSSELNKLSEETNAETARLKFDYRYNDENHPERFYYRSDHFNYAKHGIPIIFYFNGVHRDYHQPTDDVDKIDFERMERIDRMIFALGWRIANLDHRLVVDKKPAAIEPTQ